MSKIFEYIPHPRGDELRAARPVRTRDMRPTDHPKAIVRFNSRVGLLITVAVGSMWCAYVFAAIALIALPDAIKSGPYFIVVWLSSSFLQLVLLPIIIVGQNIQARAADKRSEETYKDAEAVLKEASQIQEHLEAQDLVITKIVNQVDALSGSGA
jgi:hypothetical protein